MVVDIPDIVTYTNFGDHRLRGFWVAGGQISPSPIDFHRRPYNTLALPCERVITRETVITGRSLRCNSLMVTQQAPKGIAIPVPVSVELFCVTTTMISAPVHCRLDDQFIWLCKCYCLTYSAFTATAYASFNNI